MKLPAVEWQHVSFGVRQGFWLRRKVIIDDLSLRVMQGMALGLVGPNGAGKTTTIMLGAGLLKPHAGSVKVAGKEAGDAASRRGIGYLTERPYFYPRLTLFEWLHMLGGLSRISLVERRRAVDRCLDLLDLQEQGPRQMKTLSKGQLQRAGLAQALLHDPAILLLDEPMSGLDPYWRRRFLEILKKLKRDGRTIVFSSHILSDVEKICDEAVLIDQGVVRWMDDLSVFERSGQTFDIRFESEDQEILSELSGKGALVADDRRNRWRLRIEGWVLEEVLALAVGKKIRLESLNPVQTDLEEVLFRFDRNPVNFGDRL